MERKHLIGYPIVAIIAILITYFCTKGPGPVIPTTPIQPKEIISRATADTLFKTYSINRGCIIRQFEGKRDTILDSLCPSNRKPDENFKPSRSFDLTSKFLKQYTTYVEKMTGDTLVTGYRLYLGNYPDKEKFASGKPIPDPRRNTFFIAPTTQSGSPGVNRGFTFVDDDKDGVPEIQFIDNELGIYIGDRKDASINKKGKEINTASFFSYFAANFDPEFSLIANELGSYP